MRFIGNNRLFCFSPPVMIATFVLELVLAIYMIVRYKLTSLTRTAVLLLLALSLFQFAEYNVCVGDGSVSSVWARVGLMATTILPVVALRLIYIILKRPSNLLLWFSYFTAAIWLLVFMLPAALGNSVCGGNYAIFQISVPNISGFYVAYYFGWIVVGSLMCVYGAKKATKRVQRALNLQLVGYASFIVPVAITGLIKPDTLQGLPSIMCGFAVLYALTIVFGIIPAMHVPKAKQLTKS